MSFDRYLTLIEEYFDGELDGPVMVKLNAHLPACPACRAALTELQRDEEFYSLHRPDLEISPGCWKIVLSRILAQPVTGQ